MKSQVHNYLNCDLCKMGREKLCEKQRKTLTEFQEVNIGQGLFKDSVFRKKKFESKIIPEKRSPI